MTTPAQRRATDKYRAKLKKGGWIRVSVWLSPAHQKRLATASKGANISWNKAVQTAIEKLS